MSHLPMRFPPRQKTLSTPNLSSVSSVFSVVKKSLCRTCLCRSPTRKTLSAFNLSSVYSVFSVVQKSLCPLWLKKYLCLQALIAEKL